MELEMQEENMEVYELFDNRNKGFIDVGGLSDAMKVLGFEADRKQIEEMMEVLDKKKSGIIRKEDFKKFMTAIMVQMSNI
jgi:Ca2+-binding EF-hand superfamily protein